MPPATSHRLLLIPLLLIFIFVGFVGGCATVETTSSRPPRRLIVSLPEMGYGQDDTRLSEAADAEVLDAEPEQTMARELQDLERLGTWEEGSPAIIVEESAAVVYDFPVTINQQVEYYLDFFQNQQRDVFKRWLERTGRYGPMIREQLRQAGLPEDLLYLAMIESGYNERAYSSAKAVGLWQFMRATGRHFNLTIDNYVDERRDPVKSTVAAAAYLSELYQEFGSWYLAVAGYNAGEGKIRKAIKKYKTTDFWELAEGRYLKLETKRYVPKLIAAILIAKEPEKYGFTDVEYLPPLDYDAIEVGRWTALEAVAVAGSLDIEELRGLNRELLKPFTPPDATAYELRVPAGKGALVAENLSRVQAIVSTGYKTHLVRKGETLTAICSKYGLSKKVLLKANDLRSAKLEAGQRLQVPFRVTKYELLPEGALASGVLAAEASAGSFILHKVQPGETVSALAAKYNVPTYLIAAWNDLDDISRISAGQQLALFIRPAAVELTAAKPAVAEQVAKGAVASLEADQVKIDRHEPAPVNGPAKAVKVASRSKARQQVQVSYYNVKTGDSLWKIAKRFEVTTTDIKRWNNLDSEVIKPGSRLRLLAAGPARETETFYQVQEGDSLWTIARKHNLPLDTIKRWNNLTSDVIYPGSSLVLKLAM